MLNENTFITIYISYILWELALHTYIQTELGKLGSWKKCLSLVL